MIIAIDGPAGSGKSTVAKILAEKLGYLYLDTGAMYRSLTYKAMKNKIDLKDEQALVSLARNSEISFQNEKIYLDGGNVSIEIRHPEVSKNTFYIAQVGEVRKYMLEMQRRIAAEAPGLVAEGRDMGTVVFPYADKKFYLTATLAERARRRYKELREKNYDVEYPTVLKETEMRDKKDRTRAIAPLRKAKDAVVLDTTKMTIAQELAFLLNGVMLNGVMPSPSH